MSSFVRLIIKIKYFYVYFFEKNISHNPSQLLMNTPKCLHISRYMYMCLYVCMLVKIISMFVVDNLLELNVGKNMYFYECEYRLKFLLSVCEQFLFVLFLFTNIFMTLDDTNSSCSRSYKKN